MKLSFCSARRPTSTEELAPHQVAQLEHAAELYFGEPREAASLFEGDDEEDRFAPFLDLWEVADEAGTVLYEAWLYMVDSGTVFRAGTTEVVAEVIQCGLECADPRLEAALLHAAKASRGRFLGHDMTIRS